MVGGPVIATIALSVLWGGIQLHAESPTHKGAVSKDEVRIILEAVKSLQSDIRELRTHMMNANSESLRSRGGKVLERSRKANPKPLPARR